MTTEELARKLAEFMPSRNPIRRVSNPPTCTLCPEHLHDQPGTIMRAWDGKEPGECAEGTTD